MEHKYEEQISMKKEERKIVKDRKKI